MTQPTKSAIFSINTALSMGLDFEQYPSRCTRVHELSRTVPRTAASFRVPKAFTFLVGAILVEDWEDGKPPSSHLHRTPEWKGQRQGSSLFEHWLFSMTWATMISIYDSLVIPPCGPLPSVLAFSTSQPYPALANLSKPINNLIPG